MVKVLAVSDIHADRGLVEKIKEIAKKERPDLLILAGDITWFGDEEPKVIGPLKNYAKYVIIIPGNHEDPSLTYLWQTKYNVIDLHQKVIDLGDVVLAGIGGGNVPIFMISEEDIREGLEILSEKLRDNSKFRILISHIHPHYTTSSKFGEGSKELFKFIKEIKPDLVIHGHMHEAGGVVETIDDVIIINVARNPKIIEINEKTREVKIRDAK